MPTRSSSQLPDHPRQVLRLARQLAAVEAWNAALAERVRSMEKTHVTREQQLDVDRQLEVLHRAHDAVVERTDRCLRSAPGTCALPTAVVAHRHEWFTGKLAEALTAHGVEVLAVTANGSEALGVVVAEQPDLLLVDETLAMLTGAQLLAEVALFAAWTAPGAQVADGTRVAGMLDAGARTVFTRRVPPVDVAGGLVALLGSDDQQPERAPRQSAGAPV